MEHILYNSYFFENDQYGKDAYDYAREFLFEEDTEHRFSDDDYIDDKDQLILSGFETYKCPVCGDIFNTLIEAKECCRDQKWESELDIPDDIVSDEVYFQDSVSYDDFKREFSGFINQSANGFLLCGTIGRWTGPCSGGCYINCFDDLYNFWGGCDYIKVYDKKGHLYIEASHHDGTNYAELKEITDKGGIYKNSHYYDSDREVHDTLFNNNFYTRLPHYAHRVWGCKKGS